MTHEYSKFKNKNIPYAIAKHTGTMEAREIVAGLKNNLERLTGWHD